MLSLWIACDSSFHLSSEEILKIRPMTELLQLMILSNDMQGLRNTCAWSIFRKGGRRVEAEAMILSDIKELSKTPVAQGSSGESVSMWGVEVVWSKLAGLGMGGVRVSRRPGIRRAASRRRTC